MLNRILNLKICTWTNWTESPHYNYITTGQDQKTFGKDIQDKIRSTFDAERKNNLMKKEEFSKHIDQIYVGCGAFQSNFSRVYDFGSISIPNSYSKSL